MTVRLYEWDKTEVGWAWIEITDNKVVNLKLRDENNLIKINEDDEAYVDLQLDDGIEPDDDLPVGVETWRVLVADGRPVNGTLILAKTTSWDEIQLLYWDDWKIYADNGTWTFKTLGWTTAYFKTQAEYDELPASKTSDNNLYIIVDSHYNFLSWSELEEMWWTDALAYLNQHPIDYRDYYYSTGDVEKIDLAEAMGLTLPEWKYLYQYEGEYHGDGLYTSLLCHQTNLTLAELEQYIPWAPQEVYEGVINWTWSEGPGK